MDGGILSNASVKACHGSCDVRAMAIAVIVLCGVIAVTGAHPAIA